MSETSNKQYVVRGDWAVGSGRATFLCPTAEMALQKLRQFKHERYKNIEILGLDGSKIDESDLIAAQSEDMLPIGGAPVIPDALSLPALAA